MRFISVTDQFDSKTADFSEKSFVVPIKNFVNESYCRDISGKVRSHQKIKREKGEFIGAFAPYGYCKDPENKNCLVIDSYAADIVRKIFSWKIDGFSLGAIAEKLNVRHVQSPKEYKKANGENYNSGFHSSDTPKWSAVQVKRILTNEVYIGNMVQGKQERISYKVKQRLDKPESEWVKVENTHPVIIRQNDFDVVQKLLQYDGRASKTSDSANFFSGFVFCGDCKTPMIRRVNQYKGKKKAFYICQIKNKGGDCTRHSIPEEVLKEKTGHPVIPISAKEEKGITELEEQIKDMFFGGEISFNDEVYITNARHKAALEEADRSLDLVRNSIEMGMPEDFFSIDLMNAYENLGKILGESVGEDLVNEIFSKFCMGK